MKKKTDKNKHFLCIDNSVIETLLSEAKKSQRNRSHLLLHKNQNDFVQRLIIVGLKNTYIRPHMHADQWEMLILLRGSGDLLKFDQKGSVLERIKMSETNIQAIQIEPGTFHGFIISSPFVVMTEVKPGPFKSNSFAKWAPAEGELRSKDFLLWLETAPLGQAWF